jgi:hypothetical protein
VYGKDARLPGLGGGDHDLIARHQRDGPGGGSLYGCLARQGFLGGERRSAQRGRGGHEDAQA